MSEVWVRIKNEGFVVDVGDGNEQPSFSTKLDAGEFAEALVRLGRKCGEPCAGPYYENGARS